MEKDKEIESLLKDIPGLELIEEAETKQDGGTIIDVLDNKDDSRVFVELGSKESRKLLTHEVIERKSNGYYNITIDFIKFLMKKNLLINF